MTKTTGKTVTDQMIREAEHWYRRYKSGPLSMEDRARFTAWYERDINHPQAFEQVFITRDGGVDFSARHFPLSANGAVKAAASPAGRLWGFSRRPVFWGSGIAAAVLLLLFFLQPLFTSVEIVIYSTPRAEIDHIDLSDGSRVILGAGSRLRVPQFAEGERTVYLDQGEALFEVTSAPDRPFRVLTGETEIRVLGTKFTINKASEVLTVSLIEGRLSVVQETPGPILPFLTTEKSVELDPAHSVAVRDGILQQPRAREVSSMTGWVTGQLTYQDASLKQLVDDLNRYSPYPVRLADPRLKNRTVTVTFNTAQIDSVIRGLPYLLPVTVARDRSGAYVIQSK